MEKFDKIDPLNLVDEFHRTFHHPVPAKPAFPPDERCRLRVSLLTEELNELKTAIANADLVQVADALCDLQYVLAGAVLEFGLGGKFPLLFNEVQRSNMSKACKTEEEAQKTVRYYRIKENTECFYEKVDRTFLVYRSSDRKILKSVNYSPPDRKRILSD